MAKDKRRQSYTDWEEASKRAEKHESVLTRTGLIALLSAIAGMTIILTTVLPRSEEFARPHPVPTPPPVQEAKAQHTMPRPSRTDAVRTPEPEPTQTKTPDWIHADFSKSVVIGNSTTEALYIRNMLEGADFLYGTGLTVEDVMTKSMPGSSVAIIDELAFGDYNQVFLAFGLNELGWPDDAVFLKMYTDVIARVRQYQPTAAIYIESVLPVGIGTSRRNRFGVNQDRINQVNAMLAQFAAEQNVHFIDVSTEMKGPDGYLPQDASSDGIHPNLAACQKWADLIALRVEEVLNRGTGATPPPGDVPPAPEQAAAIPANPPAAEPAAPEQPAEAPEPGTDQAPAAPAYAPAAQDELSQPAPA